MKKISKYLAFGLALFMTLGHTPVFANEDFIFNNQNPLSISENRIDVSERGILNNNAKVRIFSASLTKNTLSFSILANSDGTLDLEGLYFTLINGASFTDINDASTRTLALADTDFNVALGENEGTFVLSITMDTEVVLSDLIAVVFTPFELNSAEAISDLNTVIITDEVFLANVPIGTTGVDVNGNILPLNPLDFDTPLAYVEEVAIRNHARVLPDSAEVRFMPLHNQTLQTADGVTLTLLSTLSIQSPSRSYPDVEISHHLIVSVTGEEIAWDVENPFFNTIHYINTSDFGSSFVEEMSAVYVDAQTNTAYFIVNAREFVSDREPSAFINFEFITINTGRDIQVQNLENLDIPSLLSSHNAPRGTKFATASDSMGLSGADELNAELEARGISKADPWDFFKNLSDLREDTLDLKLSEQVSISTLHQEDDFFIIQTKITNTLLEQNEKNSVRAEIFFGEPTTLTNDRHNPNMPVPVPRTVFTRSFVPADAQDNILDPAMSYETAVFLLDEAMDLSELYISVTSIAVPDSVDLNVSASITPHLFTPPTRINAEVFEVTFEHTALPITNIVMAEGSISFTTQAHPAVHPFFTDLQERNISFTDTFAIELVFTNGDILPMVFDGSSFSWGGITEEDETPLVVASFTGDFLGSLDLNLISGILLNNVFIPL